MGSLSGHARLLAALLILFYLVVPAGAAVNKDVSGTGRIEILVEKRTYSPLEVLSYTVVMDGQGVHDVQDAKSEKSGPAMIALEGVSAGTHRISTSAVYGGTGYGIFTYHDKNYKYPASGEYSVKVVENETSVLKITLDDHKGILADLEKRPFINYEAIERSSMSLSSDVAEKSAEVASIKPTEVAEKQPQPVVGIDKKAEPAEVPQGETIKAAALVSQKKADISKIGSASFLTGLGVYKSDGRVEVQLRGDAALDKFNIFELSNPDRIVIDIFNVKRDYNKDRIKVNSKLVKTIRLGDHPGKVRVVLDIPKKGKTRHSIERSGDVLSVIVGRPKRP